MKEQSKVPLFEALKNYALLEDVVPFDVPGHKKGKGIAKEWKDLVGENIFKMDVNSMKELDLLNHPTGVIKEAEELMAEAFGADNAFFIVNGSTGGVTNMILSAIRPGEKIILPRNVHKSAINALIVSGAIPVYVQPEVDPVLGVARGVSVNSITRAIEENPDAKAVFVINPTYFGMTSDLKKIIRIAHEKNMAVLVDEAHGSHFPFHKDFPYSASKLGADLSVCSMHKTGGALTQSSVLLHNEGIIKRSQVRSSINLLQTTSANYLLMASLDIARREMVINGDKIFTNILDVCRIARKRINEIPGYYCYGQDVINDDDCHYIDETKLVVKVNDLGLTGFEVYDILRNEYNIQVELGETYVILAIVSVGDNEESVNRLVTALEDISKRYYKENNTFYEKNILLKNPEVVVSPREAFYSEKIMIPIKEAEGRISGDSIMIYPPGIPLVTPGEKISKEVIDYYLFLYSEDNITVGSEEKNKDIQIAVLV